MQRCRSSKYHQYSSSRRLASNEHSSPIRAGYFRPGPKSLGGDGEGTNPEQLFAAGYGACFASTVATLAKAAGTPITDVRVDAEVEFSSDGSHYDLAVRLRVHAAGVDQPTLAGLAEKAKDTCPYSRALRSGVTTVTVG